MPSRDAADPHECEPFRYYLNERRADVDDTDFADRPIIKIIIRIRRNLRITPDWSPWVDEPWMAEAPIPATPPPIPQPPPNGVDPPRERTRLFFEKVNRGTLAR